MLLDEDPATLIQHTIGNFNIAPDKGAIARISESLTSLHQARGMRLREAEDALHKLSRTHNNLATQYSESAASHSSASHATQLSELDTRKFRIAKAADELETESGHLETELEKLRDTLQKLELQGVEGDPQALRKRESEDPVILRLKLYRTLGIDVEPDAAGMYNKAVVRNNARGDVHVVTIDPKFSRFFYANYLWATI